jgi:hypothetical protein
MTVLTTSLDRRSEAFAANAAAMRALLTDLREKVGAIREGGGAEARRPAPGSREAAAARAGAGIARPGFAVSRIIAARRFILSAPRCPTGPHQSRPAHTTPFTLIFSQ